MQDADDPIDALLVDRYSGMRAGLDLGHQFVQRGADAFKYGVLAIVGDIHDMADWSLLAVVEAASNDEKLALIRTHPDLAGKAARAGALTEHSASEQAGVGLDRLSGEEYARFHRLNDAYKARFGFPFVIAVRGHIRETILAAFETRLQNDQGSEIAEALHNIGLIAQFRLEGMLAG